MALPNAYDWDENWITNTYSAKKWDDGKTTAGDIGNTKTYVSTTKTMMHIYHNTNKVQHNHSFMKGLPLFIHRQNTINKDKPPIQLSIHP